MISKDELNLICRASGHSMSTLSLQIGKTEGLLRNLLFRSKTKTIGLETSRKIYKNYPEIVSTILEDERVFLLKSKRPVLSAIKLDYIRMLSKLPEDEFCSQISVSKYKNTPKAHLERGNFKYDYGLLTAIFCIEEFPALCTKALGKNWVDSIKAYSKFISDFNKYKMAKIISMTNSYSKQEFAFKQGYDSKEINQILDSLSDRSLNKEFIYV